MAAASRGIPHPPGSPTWVLLASTFIRLFPFEDPVFGTNIFSVFCGTGTIFTFMVVVMLWVWQMNPMISKDSLAFTGIVFSVIVLHSSAFLEQCLTTEQYSLMTFFIGIFILILTCIQFFYDDKNQIKIFKDDRILTLFYYLIGLTLGLAIGNHFSQIVLGSFLVMYLIVDYKNTKNRNVFLKHLILSTMGAMSGLIIYLCIPILSQGEPVLDFGNVNHFNRLLEFVSRRHYLTRAFSEVPKGFLKEWLKSYDILFQVGFIGFILASVGFFGLVKKNKKILLWLGLLTVPYAVGMLVAHMKQANIQINYIHEYGVTDWHLPIYIVFALAAAFGFSMTISLVQKFKSYLAWPVSFLIILFLSIDTYHQIKKNSFRHFTAPLAYIDVFSETLPEQSIFIPLSDNSLFMMGYSHFYLDMEKDLLLFPNLPSIAKYIQAVEDTGSGWNQINKIHYFLTAIKDPENHIFKMPEDYQDMIHDRRIFTEYDPRYNKMSSYLIPHGLIFELTMNPTTVEDIRIADRAWRKKYPHLIKKSSVNPQRLERMAWFDLYFHCGMFYFERKMWTEAEEFFIYAADWYEKRGRTWYFLGYAQERLNKVMDAISAYKNAIYYEPSMLSPKLNLGVIYAKAGLFEKAEILFLDILKIDPNHKRAQHNLMNIKRVKNMNKK